MRELLCGIDEAGRGPVIGPLVIGAVAVPAADLASLEALGLKDSKALTPADRERLDGEIRGLATVRLRVLDPLVVDEATRRNGLNGLEAAAMAGLLRELQPGRAWVDGLTSKPEKFGRQLEGLALPHRVMVTAESKADTKYALVMAASIVAKVARDAAIARIAATHGDVGSGYPGDPRTICFLEACAKRGAWPDFVRQSWSTLARFALEPA